MEDGSEAVSTLVLVPLVFYYTAYIASILHRDTSVAFAVYLNNVA